MTATKCLKTARAVIALLAEKWPQTFAVYEVRRKPLKIGICNDLVAALAGSVSTEELVIGLRWYCNNVGYLRACKEGVPRIDLDGHAVGAVVAGAAESAVERLAAFKSRSAARKANKAVAAPVMVVEAPRRLSLRDLKAAAQARKTSQQDVKAVENGYEEGAAQS
jgi:sRNA-binding protein